jgi:uncharacterized protein (TIGR02217 family)
MSTQVFPSTAQCPGIDIAISRKVTWDTIVQTAMSGKEVRVATRQFPFREFALKFNFLRSSTVWLELQTFEGFFNNRQGQFDSFLWTDPDDNTITSQGLGNGDSTNPNFQLLRAFGNFVEPIYAPNTVTSVSVGSTVLTSTQYTIAFWGATNPGIINFTTAAPPSGQAVAASFTFYWPVHFTADDMTFDRFVNLIYEDKKLTFKTIL